MSDEKVTTRKPEGSQSSSHRGGSRPQGRGGRPRGRRQFYSRPRVCQFCSDKNLKIDYKNVEMLKKFVSEHGKIRPRRQTGSCAKHQRKLATAIKQARHIALLPFVSDSLR